MSSSLSMGCFLQRDLGYTLGKLLHRRTQGSGQLLLELRNLFTLVTSGHQIAGRYMELNITYLNKPVLEAEYFVRYIHSCDTGRLEVTEMVCGGDEPAVV